MDSKSGSEAWDIFKEQLNKVVDDNVPVRRRRNHNRPAWLSRDILRAIRRKKQLWKRYRQGGSKEEYEKEEKNVRNLIRSAKRRHEKKLGEGGGKDNTGP